VADRSAEEVRNERLRLVDWRFLLASPHPRRVLCRAGGPLDEAFAEALASIAGEIVPASAGGDCDLAVAVDPGELELRELCASLVPGGACVTEWHLRSVGTGTVEAALRRAGFDEVTCYRRWPRSARLAAFWLPVGSAGAEAYVRARARQRGGRVRRLADEVAGRAGDLLRGRLGPRICAVARCRGGSGAEADPARVLRTEWAGWNLGPAPEQLSVLLATGGPRTVSKVVLLAFADPAPVPVVALKAPRVPEAADGVRREAMVLERLGAASVAGVPRLLLRRELAGVPLIAETALPGRPLEGLIETGNLMDWSTKVTDWLVGLARGATTRPAVQWREALVEPALARFRQTFGAVADPDLLRSGEGLVREIGDLPSVPEQRDFGPWNVLVGQDGGLAVLDWESAEVEGLPALDLLYFLAYASFGAERAWDRDGRVAAFTRSLDPASATGAVRRACLERYARALGLDPARLAPLRALVWLIHAHSDFRHAMADAGGSPPADALRRSLFLALWTAEVRDIRGQ
jgi:hypothetical protein